MADRATAPREFASFLAFRGSVSAITEPVRTTEPCPALRFSVSFATLAGVPPGLRRHKERESAQDANRDHLHVLE